MSNTSLGIDVSKLELSIALLKDTKVIKAKVKNDDSGFKNLHKFLHKHKAKDAKICMEATGHYYFAVADFMHKKGFLYKIFWQYPIKP